ncbi:MAG: lytic transglycosylase domain-containing protein [Parvibaculum sp.]|uniref:lytic transglycosylase domain-containing protein n=1 Tax=Parvibaculum sp. TaxID=2024848 RepID=UPI003C77BA0D
MSLLQAIAAQPQIAAALQQASAKTGADFNYLLNTAMRESSLDCSAKSSTSTACGLFQFTQQSWLGTMKKDGGDLGLGQYADAISQDSKGRYVVADPAARQAILALRNDPEVSALMAGAYTNNSRETLEGKLGRSVSGGELYIAHFLGAGGASKLISSSEDAPNARADLLFPDAAAANRSIFYTRDGQPRSVAEVYSNLVAKHEGVSAPRFEIAARPPLAEAAGAASLGALTNALTGADDVTEADAPASTDMSSATATPYSSAYSTSAMSAAGLGGRSPLRMSPAVVQILASLDVPNAASSTRGADDDKDKERENERRMLPRGGLALG